MHAAVSDHSPFVLQGVVLGVNPAYPRLRVDSLSVQRGVTAVLGWSGAGKTSLLNLLAGFEQPAKGTVHSSGSVAWVPQNDGLWPHCTAREHLMECGASPTEADQFLYLFDLARVVDQKPAVLSRGEQSRLSIARALALPPRTLVMDEPLAHVDPARAGRYWEVIRTHIARTGVSLVFSTHSPAIALAEATHAIGLHSGAVLYSGDMAALYDTPATEQTAHLLGPTNWLEPDTALAWLGAAWSQPRSIRPECLALMPSTDGPAVVASRFYGTHSATELRDEKGECRVFLHRPAQPPQAGSRVRLALLCFLVFLGLAGCSQHDSESPIPVKETRGWMLPAEGPTQPTPRSLTTGPANELAVLDTAGRVLIYDSKGTLLRQWKMLDVQFGKPEGIVWLKDGQLVVCDTHYHRLVWFDQNGKVNRVVGERGTGPAQFVFPVGITKDAAENLYVCEYGGHDRVQVFSRDGTWLREFGSPGTGPGQFQRPSGLVWHAGQVFVADAVNNRILVFKDSGEYVGLLGAHSGANRATSALSFNLPYDIALAPDGAFYVIEYGAGRLSKVSTDGRLLGRYGSTGGGSGEFATPWGLAVDNRMRIYVADTKNRRIISLQL